MFSLRKAAFIFFLLLAAPVFFIRPGLCSQDHSIQTQYFAVYYYDGCDLAKLAGKLNAEHFLHIDVFSQENTAGDISSVISRLIDSIYLEVCDILDIHIYSFNGVISIVPDDGVIADITEKYSGQRIKAPSFYFLSQNTVYVSFNSLNLGMLGHELAHAVISHYFVVAPPPKVQEILTGYVEYSLRKATGTLSEIRR